MSVIGEFRLRLPVHAVRYSAVTSDLVLAFIMANAKCSRRLHYLSEERNPQVWVNAQQAWARLAVGDWVVADEIGIQIFTPDAFDDRYEAVVSGN